MKSCPTCNRTYPDDNLAFCLMDGSVLSAPYDPSETRAAPPRSNEPPPTEVISAPAKSAETRAPLQSTIRAPLPQVPDLHAPLVAHPPEQTIAVPLLFRLPLATRGILAAVCILPWFFESGSSRPWYRWYPTLAGVLAIAAGAFLYARHKTGWFLIIEGIVAVLGALILSEDWRHWHASWPVVSGALLLAAAVELRKHITRTWLLAVAGLIFAVYSVGSSAKYILASQQSFNSAFYALKYLQAVPVLLSGITLTAFSFLTRGVDLTDSN